MPQQDAPQTNAPSIPYSGFWARFGAVVIDSMALQIVLILLSVGTFFLTPAGEPDAPVTALNVLFLIILIAYKPLMECSRYQATLGKIAAGLKVTDLKGNRLHCGRAFGRSFAMILSTLPLYIGFLLPAFTQKKQALHDMIAGTVVVKTSRSYFWRIMAIALVFYIAVMATAGLYVAKHLGIWVSSGLTSAATALKQDVVKADIQSAVIPEKVEKTKPLFPYVASEQQYEEILATHDVKQSQFFDPKTPKTSPAKPITLELGTFFDGQATQWIKAYAAPETNLGRGGYAIILIDHALNAKGEEIYDKDSTFESETFQKIFDSQMSQQDDNPVETIRQVHLKAGTKESDIQSISGTLHLYLPVNSKLITLSGADVGKPQDILPNLQLTVLKFGNGAIEVDMKGEGSHLLLNNFYAYNANNELLENSGWSASTHNEDQTKTYQFKGTPTSAQLIVTEKMLEKEYPFTLKK